MHSNHQISYSVYLVLLKSHSQNKGKQNHSNSKHTLLNYLQQAHTLMRSW